MSESYDVAVIGGGPAGMEAAVTAAEHGVKTILIDNFANPGGQYYKAMPDHFKLASLTKTETEGDILYGMVKALPVTLVKNSLVWGVFPDEKQGGWLVAVRRGAPKTDPRTTVVLPRAMTRLCRFRVGHCPA